MSENDWQCLSNLIFFGLYSLVHITETADKALNEVESGQFEQFRFYDTHFKGHRKTVPYVS